MERQLAVDFEIYLTLNRRRAHPSTVYNNSCSTFYASRVGWKMIRPVSGCFNVKVSTLSSLSYFQALSNCIREQGVNRYLPSYALVIGMSHQLPLPIYIQNFPSTSALSGSHGEWTMSDDVQCTMCLQVLYNPVVQNGNPRSLHHATKFNLTCQANCDTHICITCAANIFISAAIRPNNPDLTLSKIECPFCRVNTNVKATQLIPFIGFEAPITMDENRQKLRDLLVEVQQLMAGGRHRHGNELTRLARIAVSIQDSITRLGNQNELRHRRHILSNLPVRLDGLTLYVAPVFVPRPAGVNNPAIPGLPPGPPPNQADLGNGAAPPLVVNNPPPPIAPIPQIIPPNPPLGDPVDNLDFQGMSTLYTQSTILDGTIWDFGMISFIFCLLLIFIDLSGRGRYSVLLIPILVKEKKIPVDREHLYMYISILASIIIMVIFSSDSFTDNHSDFVDFAQIMNKLFWFFKRCIKLYIAHVERWYHPVSCTIIFSLVSPFLYSRTRRNLGLIRIGEINYVGWPIFVPRIVSGVPDGIFGYDIQYEHLPPNLKAASPYKGFIPNVPYYRNIYNKCLPSRYANEPTKGLLRYIGGDIQNIILSSGIPLDTFDPVVLINTGYLIHQSVLTVRFADENNNSHNGTESAGNIIW